MPMLGAHLSVSQGYDELFLAADKIGCEAVQIFAKNQRQWENKPIEASSASSFREKRAKSNVQYANVHASYLLNLVTPDDKVFNKSVASLLDDMNRAELLGISDTVVHPGSHMGSGDKIGIARIAGAIEIILNENSFCNLLLETTSGQGTSIGWRFEHIRDILSKLKDSKRVFVCYDTCHTFAAGYDIRTAEEYEKTFDLFDRIVGIDKIRLFHINDSKNELGTRKDRHEFLGKGFIGIDAFRMLVNDSRFKDHPMILEVPGDYDDFKKEIKTLNSFIKRR